MTTARKTMIKQLLLIKIIWCVLTCVLFARVAEAALTSVTITPENTTKIQGVTVQYTAIAHYDDQDDEDVTSRGQWSSSDDTVATIVTDTGLATIVGTSGSTDIHFKFDDDQKTYSTKLSATELTGLVITPDNATKPEGSVINYVTTAQYKDIPDETVTTRGTWESDDVTVATVVESTGQATVVGKSGQALIKFTFTDNGQTYSTKLNATGPAQLSVTQSPGSAVAGEKLLPVPTVEVQDKNGETVPASTALIIVQIKAGTGTPGAQLLGTTQVEASNGVATFADLQIDKAGRDYQLRATAEDLGTADSNAFTIRPVGDFCGPNFGPPDGYVDVWDLMQFADHWHSRTGEGNWDSKFDLAGPNFGDADGYIDVWDLMVFADNWHEGQKP